MLKHEFACFKHERRFSCAGIFGILKQLVNEVRSVRIERFDNPPDARILGKDIGEFLTLIVKVVQKTHVVLSST